MRAIKQVELVLDPLYGPQLSEPFLVSMLGFSVSWKVKASAMLIGYVMQTAGYLFSQP